MDFAQDVQDFCDEERREELGISLKNSVGGSMAPTSRAEKVYAFVAGEYK